MAKKILIKIFYLKAENFELMKHLKKQTRPYFGYLKKFYSE